MPLEKERLDYIDVAKALGMFAIYLGHFGEKAGYAYLWVFSWHVPFFFFLAGCMVHKEKKRTFPEYALHKGKTIFLPWFIFALFYTMVSDGTLWEVQTALYFRWTCLSDGAVPELAAGFGRNDRRLS